jgi:hypothetical protein
MKNPPFIAIEELAKSDRMAVLRDGQQLRVTAPPRFQFGSPLVDLESGPIKRLDWHWFPPFCFHSAKSNSLRGGAIGGR